MKSLLANLSVRQRITIAIVALAVAGGIYALIHYQHEADFKPLFTGLAPEDAAAIVQKLKEGGVEYRLPEAGGAVLVPSSRLAELRLTLAAAGLPKTGRIGFELFDKANLGATEFTEHINYRRALEGELERSVMSLAEVEQARVHLTFPKDSVFLDAQQPAKASVLVKIRPGAHLSPPNVLAINHLVASAVEGLSPDAVSVLDMNGNLLGQPKPAGSLDGPEPSEAVLDFRHHVEADLLSKINATLEPLLGAESLSGRSLGGVRLYGRRTERGDFRSGALRDAEFATYGGRFRRRHCLGCTGHGVHPAASHLASRDRFQGRIALDREHHLPIEPHREENPPAGRRCPQDVGGNPGRSRRDLAAGQERIPACAGATGAREAEDHPRPGGRYHRLHGRARRPVGDRDAALRDYSAARTAAAPGAPATASPTAPKWGLCDWIRVLLTIGGGAVGAAIVVGLVVLLFKRTGRRHAPVEMQPALPPGEEGAPAVAPAGSGIEHQLESKLAERDALQKKIETQALNSLKLAPVITKTAEVLAKHLREKIKQEPEISAQILRTWIREEES